MLSVFGIVVVSLAYLALLFAIAFYADRQALAGRSLIRNPYVYTLSIAVYCTSWTFYGAVGSAARNGLEFATIYLGPTLIFLGWWFLLRKIVRISKTHRITSIADFISSRYGKSPRLGMLVTLIAVTGTMPYIALQLKAVTTSFNVLAGYRALNETATLAHPTTVFADTAFWVAGGMAAFVILFGTRQIDADEHHEGVVAAVAFESFVKLFALLAVGLFVTFGLYNGFGDLFESAAEVPGVPELFAFPQSEGPRWLTLTLLSMAAAFCLPRQFQIAVVENVDERHLATASWLFPLYMLAMSLFALPIALAGLTLLPSGADPDFFVLTLPMVWEQEALALVAFIGGLSSATSMVIVAAIALSTMVCNDLVMPALLRIRWLRLTERGDLSGLLLFIRRTSIILVFLLGFGYYRLAGESGALAAIGLVSFAAVAQFVPCLVGGLFWRGGTRTGAQLALILGFAVWAYTLLLPSFARTGWLDPAFIETGPWSIAVLRPEALFGLNDWDNLAHALFWSLLANVGGYVGGSLFSSQDALERLQSALFVDVFRRPARGEGGVWTRSAAVEDLYDLVQRFLGRDRAYRAFRDYARARGRSGPSLPEADADLIAFVERLLAGSLGAASARVVVASVAKGEMPRLEEVMKILEETHQAIEYSHKLEQKSKELEATAAELKRANARLQELDKLKDDFLSTVSHELRTPLTSIRSFAEILEDYPDLRQAQSKRYLAIITSESQRLTRLIDQILDLARLEQGRSEWNLAEIDTAQTLRAAIDAAGGLFQDRHLRLETDILGGGPPLCADRDRLIQVFVNLLSNAIKYADPDNGWVGVRGRPVSGGYQVSVADNGPGVSAQDQARIFDKFAQATENAADRPPGTGLGLAISRHIVEYFGGRIWIDTERRGGAVFHVFLPMAVRGASAPVASAAAPG